MNSTAKLPERFVPAALVIECVAGFFAVAVDDLRGPTLSRSLTTARQIAALLMLEHSMLSNAEIGRALGRASNTAGRDFIALGTKLRNEDARFAQMLQQVSERLVGGEGVAHGE